MECCDLTVLSASDPVPEGMLDVGADPSAQAIEQAVATGRPVAVRLAGLGAGVLAAASVYAWMGARYFIADETAHAELRQVLDMVATIRGTRPPALTRRGLA